MLYNALIQLVEDIGGKGIKDVRKRQVNPEGAKDWLNPSLVTGSGERNRVFIHL